MSAREWNQVVDEVSRLGKIAAQPPLQLLPTGAGVQILYNGNTEQLPTTFQARLTGKMQSAISTTLTSGVATGDATISVGNASSFPTAFPYYIQVDGGNSNEEIMLVTGVSANVFTVTRNVVQRAMTHASTHAVRLLLTSYAWVSQYENAEGQLADDPNGLSSAADPAVAGNSPAFCSNPLGWPMGNPASSDANTTPVVTLYLGQYGDYFFDYPSSASYYQPGVIDVDSSTPQFLGNGSKIINGYLGLGGQGSSQGTFGEIGFTASGVGTGVFTHNLSNYPTSPYLIYLNYASSNFSPATNNSTAGGSAIGFDPHASLLTPGYCGAGVAFVCGSTGSVTAPAATSAIVTGGPSSFPAGTYYYVITALTPQGESTAGVVSVGRSGMTSSQSVQVTWSAATSTYADITGYKIYRGTNSAVTTGVYLVGTIYNGGGGSVLDNYTTANPASVPITDTTSGVNTGTRNAQAGWYYASSTGLLFAGGILVGVAGQTQQPQTSVTGGTGVSTTQTSGTSTNVTLTPPAYSGSMMSASGNSG